MEDILVLLQVKLLLCGAGSPLTREERHITGSDEQDVEGDGLRYERWLEAVGRRKKYERRKKVVDGFLTNWKICMISLQMSEYQSMLKT